MRYISHIQWIHWKTTATERKRESVYLDPFDDVFARKALVIRTLTAPEEFCGDDDVGPLPSELLDGCTHNLLSPAVGVHLGIVKKVDTSFSTSMEEKLGVLDIQLVAEAHPCAIAQSTHLQSSSPQMTVLHSWLLPDPRIKQLAPLSPP